MLGPIFMREWVTVPRRASHYLQRTVALTLLWVLGLTAWQATVGFDHTATLGETARFGRMLFQIYSYVLLTLLMFFAALSAASAVSLEKDRRTFVLLLITDMRDYEIVLGKLLGSLLPIVLLLLTSIPVLAMLLLLGGISGAQVVQATVVIGATALAAGSLGGLIALWRDKTFQALALSVLALVLYFGLVHALAALPLLGVGAGVNWDRAQAWLEPFLALQTALEPPPAGEGGLSPAYGFALAMAGWSVLLNGVGVWKLRKWNPSGEPVIQREAPGEAEQAEEKERRASIHAAPGPVRRVWHNPILWREIRTFAYGRRPLLVKFAYLVALGFVCYFAFAQIEGAAGRSVFAAAYGMVPVAVLSLLLVAAQAVTSITSERDQRALDLLLVTDLSPREFVFGKLLGIAYNTKEYLLPPVILAGVYAYLGLLATAPARQPHLLASMNLAAFVCIFGVVAVLLAFVAVLGVHVALRIINSRLAVVHTLGTVFFLSVGTLICIYLILINRASFANQWVSFSVFICLGIGGLWWVLSADRPSNALTLASIVSPLAMFYAVTNVLVAKPGTTESADPLIPFLVIVSAFGFAIAAMLVPLLSEFDISLGRTTAAYEE